MSCSGAKSYPKAIPVTKIYQAFIESLSKIDPDSVEE